MLGPIASTVVPTSATTSGVSLNKNSQQIRMPTWHRISFRLSENTFFYRILTNQTVLVDFFKKTQTTTTKINVCHNATIYSTDNVSISAFLIPTRAPRLREERTFQQWRPKAMLTKIVTRITTVKRESNEWDGCAVWKKNKYLHHLMKLPSYD